MPRTNQAAEPPPAPGWRIWAGLPLWGRLIVWLHFALFLALLGWLFAWNGAFIVGNLTVFLLWALAEHVLLRIYSAFGDLLRYITRPFRRNPYP